jgi:hypothetical protein
VDQGAGFWQAVFSLCLVFCTAVQIYVSIHQFELLERPYVSSGNATASIKDQVLTVFLVAKNTGRARARLSFHSGCQLRSARGSIYDPIPFVEPPHNPQHADLATDGLTEMTAHLPLTDAQTQIILGGQIILYFYGDLVYQSDSGKTYGPERFCYLLHPEKAPHLRDNEQTMEPCNAPSAYAPQPYDPSK